MSGPVKFLKAAAAFRKGIRADGQNCGILLIACLFASFRALGVEGFLTYDLTGILRYEFMHQGAVIRATTNNFEVSIRGEGTRIRSIGIPAHGSVKVRSYEHIYDGETSAFITTFDLDPEVVDKSNTGSLDQLHSSWVSLYKTPFPPNHTGLLGPVWIATASSAFLSKFSGRAEMPPLYFIGNNVLDIGENPWVSSWYALAQETPQLPMQLAELASVDIFQAANSNYALFAKADFPSFYRAGYTNAVFQVIEWTNTMGLKLPKVFKLTGFSPDPRGRSSTDLIPQVIYYGEIQSVSSGDFEKLQVPVQFPKWTKIADYRYGLTNGQPFRYTSEFGRTLPERDLLSGAYLEEHYARRQQLARLTQNTTPRKAFRIALCALAIVPIALIFSWYAKNRRNTK